MVRFCCTNKPAPFVPVLFARIPQLGPVPLVVTSKALAVLATLLTWKKPPRPVPVLIPLTPLPTPLVVTLTVLAVLAALVFSNKAELFEVERP